MSNCLCSPAQEGWILFTLDDLKDQKDFSEEQQHAVPDPPAPTPVDASSSAASAAVPDVPTPDVPPADEPANGTEKVSEPTLALVPSVQLAPPEPTSPPAIPPLDVGVTLGPDGKPSFSAQPISVVDVIEKASD